MYAITAALSTITPTSYASTAASYTDSAINSDTLSGRRAQDCMAHFLLKGYRLLSYMSIATDDSVGVWGGCTLV